MFLPHRDRFLAWACLFLIGGTASTAVGGEVCESDCVEQLPHAQARFEHVRDANGEPWKVLIVPRVFNVVTGNAKPETPKAMAPAPEESASLPQIKGELTWISTEKQPAVAQDLADAIAQAPEPSATEAVERDEAVLSESELPTIVPNESLASLPTHVDARNYKRIYRTIPFIRSEYEANPSYRHEATMEILFGQLRPQVNVKQPVSLSHLSRTVAPVPSRYLPQFRSFYSTGLYGNGLFRDGYTVLGAGGPFYRPWGIGYPGAYNTLPPYFSTYGGYGAQRFLGWGY